MKKSDHKLDHKLKLKIMAYECKDDYMKDLTELTDGLAKIKGFKFVINDFIIINEDNRRAKRKSKKIA